MRQELTEKILNKLIPNTKFEISSYQILPKNYLNNHGEWISDSPAIFIGIKIINEGEDLKKINLTDFLTDMTGFEFSVNRV